MSSILDALNKLEQEKAQASRESERADTDPVSIANELVGRSMLRDRVTLRVTPAALFAMAGVLVVGLVVVTFAIAMMITRPSRDLRTSAAPITEAPAMAQTAAPLASPPPDPVVESVAAQTPAPSATTLVETAKPANSAATPPAPVAEVPKSIEKKADLVPAPTVQAEPKVKKTETKTPPASESVLAEADADSADEAIDEVAPVPAQKTPATSPRTRTRIAVKPLDESERVARERPVLPAASSRNEDVRLETLPVLTPVDQARYGFVRLKVNMVKPAGDTNPQGSAILTLEEDSGGGDPVVNRMPFYEGQRLQQSPLRLFKVGTDRVGVEDIRTGDRYQLAI